MIGFLRLIGIANAAVWFGATVFFTFGVGPAFFSHNMLVLFGGVDSLVARGYAGAAAMILLRRYFIMHLCCGVIALLHLVAEWLYMGRPLQRLTLWLLLGIFAVGLAGGFIIQPRLHRLHQTMYSPDVVPQLQERARSSFKVWHATSQVFNLVILAGVGVYLWRVTTPANGYRYLA